MSSSLQKIVFEEFKKIFRLEKNECPFIVDELFYLPNKNAIFPIIIPENNNNNNAIFHKVIKEHTLKISYSLSVMDIKNDAPTYINRVMKDFAFYLYFKAKSLNCKYIKFQKLEILKYDSFTRTKVYQITSIGYTISENLAEPPLELSNEKILSLVSDFKKKGKTLYNLSTF
jgi:hypothetical protein